MTALSIGMLVIAVAFNLAIWREARAFPEIVWKAAGYRRSLWLFYLTFASPMGGAYLLFVRPKLHRARRNLSASELPGVSVSWPP